MDIDDNGLSKPKSQQAFALYQKIGQMIFDSSSFFQDAQRKNAVKLRREKFSRRSRKKRAFARFSLSRNPVCTQEQTGSRTYMSEKTAKRNEDNRSLLFRVANFFKFMAANLSFTQFVT